MLGQLQANAVTNGAFATTEGAPLRTSALTGDGIGVLGRQIATQLVPDVPPRGAGVPFTPRQLGLLRAALDATKQADVAVASAHVQELLVGPLVGIEEDYGFVAAGCK